MMLLDNPNGALAFLGRTSGKIEGRVVIPTDEPEDPLIDPCTEVDCVALQ